MNFESSRLRLRNFYISGITDRKEGVIQIV